MSLIDSFVTGTYTVSRSGEGYYREGIWQPGAVETLEVKGSLQPLTAREIKVAVPEGERLKQTYKFYSDKPLNVIGTQKLKTSDKVEINGETFKVIGFDP